MISINEVKELLVKYTRCEELVTVDRMLTDFGIEDNNVKELEDILNKVSQFYTIEENGVIKYRIIFIYSDDIIRSIDTGSFKSNFDNSIISCEEDIPEDEYGIYGLFLKDRVLVCVANDSFRDNYNLLQSKNAKSKYEQDLFNDGALFKILLSTKNETKLESAKFINAYKEVFINGYRNNIDYVALNNSKGIKQRMKSKTGDIYLSLGIKEKDLSKILRLLEENNIDYRKMSIW